jgi:hypothetical protein
MDDKSDTEIDIKEEEQITEKSLNEYDKKYFVQKRRTTLMCCTVKEIVCACMCILFLVLLTCTFIAIGVTSLIIPNLCPKVNTTSWSINGGNGDIISTNYSLVNISEIVIAGDLRTRITINPDRNADYVTFSVNRRSWSSVGYEQVSQMEFVRQNLSRIHYQTNVPFTQFNDCIQVLQEVILPQDSSNINLYIDSYTSEIDILPNSNASSPRLVLGGLVVNGGQNAISLNNLSIKGVTIFSATTGTVEIDNVFSLITEGAITDGRISLTNFSGLNAMLNSENGAIVGSNIDSMGGNFTFSSTGGYLGLSYVSNAKNIKLSSNSGEIALTLASTNFQGAFSITTSGELHTFPNTSDASINLVYNKPYPNGHSAQGTINGSGPGNLEITSKSGTIIFNVTTN